MTEHVQLVVEKIHARRRVGVWDITLATRPDSWWVVVATRDNLQSAIYCFKPHRVADAREMFDAPVEVFEESRQSMSAAVGKQRN